MKTGARFLAMLLAVLMIAGAALTVSAFPDVAADNKHAKAIEVFSQLKVINGYELEDGTFEFRPDGKVTRAEMAKMIFVLSTTFDNAGAGTTVFDDVASDHWAKGFISWNAAKGIINGHGDGTFAPEDNVTYDQALKMACGALGYKNWDSNLWPIDVRTKALKELKIGTGLEDVNGDDELTRAQAAQLLFNIFNVRMNTTEQVVVNGVIVEVPTNENKTLAKDVWQFAEYDYTVVATPNYFLAAGVDKAPAGKITVKTADGQPKDVALADLGLAAADLDALLGLTIKAYEKEGKFIPTAELKGSVVDLATATKSSDSKTLTLNGTAYTKANAIKLYAYNNATGAVTVTANIWSGDTTSVTVADSLVRTIDTNGDGKVDAIAVAPLNAYVVTDVKDGDIKYKALNSDEPLTVKVANSKTTLAKNDVFVGAVLEKTLYSEIITPATTYVTKIAADGKVTLANGSADLAQGGKYSAATVSISDSLLGLKDNKTQDKVFYIYNGVILKMTNVAEAPSTPAPEKVPAIAILKDVTSSVEIVNMKQETVYKAVLVIDGADVTVTLGTIDGAAANATTVTEYGKTIDGSGFVQYNYTLVAYETVSGKTNLLTFKNSLSDTFDVIVDGQTKTDYLMYRSTATQDFSYNPATGLYTVGTLKKVVLDANSVVYYTKAIGNGNTHKALYTYTKDQLAPANGFETVGISGGVLVRKNADSSYTLIAAFIDGPISNIAAPSTPATVWTDDGALIYLATAPSYLTLGADNKVYHNYVFNGSTATALKADSVEAVKYGLYGKTANGFVQITSANADADVIKADLLANVIKLDTGVVIFTANYTDGIKVADTVKIVAENKSGAIISLTAAQLADVLAASKLTGGNTVDLIITYNKDGSMNTIYVEYFAKKTDGTLDTLTRSIFTAFGA